jgi:acetyltransferase
LRIWAEDPNTDVILILHVPTAIVSSQEVAQAVVSEIRRIDRPVLVSWMGAETVAAARAIFHAAGIPSYETPYKAMCALSWTKPRSAPCGIVFPCAT